MDFWADISPVLLVIIGYVYGCIRIRRRNMRVYREAEARKAERRNIKVQPDRLTAMWLDEKIDIEAFDILVGCEYGIEKDQVRRIEYRTWYGRDPDPQIMSGNEFAAMVDRQAQQSYCECAGRAERVEVIRFGGPSIVFCGKCGLKAKDAEESDEKEDPW